MKRDRNLTQSRLKHVLDYDRNTGIFTWIRHHRHPRLVGTVAGSKDAYGYAVIYVDGTPYKAHRLAFLYVNGRWPAGRLDHKNLEKSDNRIDNLREATAAQNGCHKPPSRANSSAYKGVDYVKNGKKWRARIAFEGVSHALGYYLTPEEAAWAYDFVAVELHGQFAHLNFPAHP